ncbi:DnaD domain protein [Halobacillus trueperi]|uniref:DnaD domain protein n=1 Tax=Halobacillus trueperi TaxID=156205 RepID=A0A3D8VLX7_9BACI|nr:DnaD domain protein [Halobacillus trueperi]RDY70293.1 DnaD domain protein [Halobacillus trueperi]
MNYIKELNAFYSQVSVSGLPARAINLFNALMHINNKTGWKETFTVRTSYLEAKTGQSPKTNDRAREDLQEAGFIRFKSRKGGKMAIYEIIPADQRVVKFEELDEEEAAPPEPKPSVDPTEEDDRNEVNIFDTFLKAFNKQPSALQVEDLNAYIDQDGLPAELVALALEEAGKGGHAFNFAKTIMNTWAKMELKTIEEAKKEMEDHKNKRGSWSNKKGPDRKQPQYSNAF